MHRLLYVQANTHNIIDGILYTIHSAANAAGERERERRKLQGSLLDFYHLSAIKYDQRGGLDISNEFVWKQNCNERPKTSTWKIRKSDKKQQNVTSLIQDENTRVITEMEHQKRAIAL